MMKKITRIAALLATTALLLAGFPACGDDDGDEDPTLTGIEINTDAVKRTYTVGDKFDTTGITVTAVYSDGSKPDVTADATIVAKIGDTEDPTLTKEDSEVTITAKYGEMDSAPVTIEITVTDNDDGTGGGTGDGNDNNDDDKENGGNDSENSGNGEGEGDKTEEDKGTTYAWDFAAADLPTYLPLTDKKLDIAATYESKPAGLTLAFPQNLQINELSPSAAVNSNATAIAEKASAGAIQAFHNTEPVGEDMNVEVQGPFTATMLYMSNASGNASDRRAYIKIGGEEVAKSEKIPVAGEELSFTYSGTDKVKVSFGSTNYIRIYDIKITTKNGDGTGKTAGEVKSTAEFVQQSESVANNVETLGLAGDNAASSDEEIATAKTEGGNVVITSAKKPGSATITVTSTSVTDGAATIAVSVKPDGSITLGQVTKYVDPNKVVDKAEWTVTVKDNVGVIDGDDGLKVAFAANNGNTTSTNKTDFKFDGSKAALTITTPKLAAGKTIKIAVYGFSGSTNASSSTGYNEVDVTLTAENAEAADGNPADNRVAFTTGSAGDAPNGTFVYTVTDNAPVKLEFKRKIGKTSNVTKLEITVGDSDNATTEE